MMLQAGKQIDIGELVLHQSVGKGAQQARQGGVALQVRELAP